MRSKSKPILLVEDDKVDIMTIKRALKDIRVRNPLEVAHDGEEGLKYLRNPEKARPCIILLDLNMPRMNGIEFLKEIKSDEDFKRIPVVILTTSKEEEDKMNTFSNGIVGYMLKPVEYQDFIDVVRTIDLYWTLSEISD